MIMERGTPGYGLVDKAEDVVKGIYNKYFNPFAELDKVKQESTEGQFPESAQILKEVNKPITDLQGEAKKLFEVGLTVAASGSPKGSALSKAKVLRTYPPELTGTTTKGSITTVPQTRIDKFKTGTSPSTIGFQSAALNNLYYKLSNPGQGDLFEAAKLAQYQKDMRNPNISLPVRVDLANSVLGSAYRTSEPFDYFKFREQSKYMRDKGRRYLAYFQAGLTQYGASKATSFDIYRKTTTPKLEQEYKKGSPLSSFQIQYKEALKVLYNSNSKPEEIEAALKTINDPQVQGLPSSSFQVHHKAALKAIMGISHGLDFDSPVFREVMGIIIEEIPWLGLGDESTNLMPIIGSTADRGTPHYLAHRFYNKILGPKGQGEEFFTKEVIDRMMVDREFRKEKAREIGQVIKRSNDIVTRATRLWELGFSNKHHFKSLDHLVDNLSQFDELGYEELSDPNYEAPIVTAIIDEIVRDGQLLPPVEKNERRQQILQDLLRLKELEDDERSADAQRKRDLKGPDNPDQEELF